MWRTLAVLALTLHTLIATGVVDLDVLVHHEPHGDACGEGAPEHEDADHAHATSCCAHRHVAIEPVAPPAFAPPAVSRVVPDVVSAPTDPLHHAFFRPPRLSSR